MKKSKVKMQKSKLQFKIKNFLFKFWPVIFIFGLWFIFVSPYFLKGKVPYASTYQVNFFPPWSHYQQFWGPVKNNAMPDVHTQIYPWKKFTIDTWRNGQIPLWNPYNFAGNPHLANFQSAVLSPFNGLFFILPFVDAWSILILLQPLLAGLFTYLFIRAIGVSRAGSVVSSIAFMFCGFIVVWMAYGTLAHAIIYLPLGLFAIERYFNTQRLCFLFLLMLTVPLSFFSGHFQISLYFLLATVAYMLFKIITTKNFSAGIGVILAIIFGLFVASFQIIPSIKLYLSSVRSETFILSEIIPAQYLITAIAPDFFGNPVTRNDWFGHYAEWASFIGIIPLMLALYAIFKRPQKEIWFFTMLVLLAVLLAVKSPLSSMLVSLKIPVISTSALSRIIVLASFGMAILSGFGLDKVLEDIKRGNVAHLRLLLLPVAGLVGFIWLVLLLGNIYPVEWTMVAKRNFVLPTVLFFAALVIIMVIGKFKKLLPVLALAFLLLVTFDSLRFAQKWMPFDPREFVYPQAPVLKAIKNNLGDGRIFGNIGDSAISSYYSFPSIDGYDPLYIARFGEFIRSAADGVLIGGERSVVKLGRRGKYTDRVLDLLGVSLIFHPIADTNAGWAYPVWEDKNRYVSIYQDDKFQLFRNTQALPRASLFYDFEIEKNDKQIIKKLYNDNFDFRKKLILEEEVDSVKKEGRGSAEIVKYTPSLVTIRVSSSEPALLFIADNFYPGWKARMNGKEIKIYRADYTFRAIVVPAGQSEVEFTYENWYL